ncbi:complement factor H like 4, partial [Stegastes partitus]|uniref:Complement factor H like 4 n=1 Tax=Stegastes partitus TaxID=144197 RepID=A0A9Y4KK95_9TELE
MRLSVILLFLQLWGNVELSLSQNACSKLPDVPHAHVSQETKKAEYQEGDVVHFPCEPGYISDHTSKYVCTSEGWLVIRRGMCYSCSKLPDVPHGRVTEETRKAHYQEGDMIHFTCEPGYTSDLTIKYICASEGWLAVRQGLCYYSCQVGEMPPDLYVAGLPPSNKTIKNGHKLRFLCGNDFKLDGSEEIECLETGEWSAPFPTCSAYCDKLSNEKLSMNFTSDKDRYMNGDVIEYQCVIPDAAAEGTATCTDGKWIKTVECK